MKFGEKINKNKIETKNNEVKDISVEESQVDIEEKISIANDSSTSIETLAELITDPSLDVKLVAEKNLRSRENVSPEILVQLSESSSDFAKVFVADHQNTPDEVLEKLITHTYLNIKLTAEKNLKNRKKKAA